MDAPKDFVITSEELDEGNGVVRFLDGENGTAVSVYFDEGKAFPSLFIINEEGKENRVYGMFSPYNDDTETFSLTLQSGEEEHTFDALTLNKNVLSAYQDDEDLTPEQNERTRRYVTAVGVWTALVLYHDSLEAEDDGIVNIVNVRENILTYAGKIFGGTKVFAKAGNVIKADVSAPVVVSVAVTSLLAVTAITLAEISAENDEEPNEQRQPTEELPPAEPVEERTAPRLKIWYEDDADNKHLIPAIQEGVSPPTAERFHIRPHDTDISTDTSAVRFYLGKH